jgi:IclR family acetate operon transcriptional repressor
VEQERQGPLERYLKIIEVVAASGEGLAMADIALLTALPKPTVYRLTGVLIESQALIATGGRQKTFRIGPRLWRVLYLGLGDDKITTYAQVTCDELARRVNETAFIVRLGLEDISTIARSTPDHGYRLHVVPGAELPSHAASSAKAILAFQSDDVVDRFIRPPLRAFTPRTKTEVAAVKSELQQVRQQGYAVCDREIDDNIIAYGWPVKQKNAGVLFSIGVTGPTSRLLQHPQDYWLDALRVAAERFATALDTLPA